MSKIDFSKINEQLKAENPLSIEDQTESLESQLRALDDRLGELPVDSGERGKLFLEKARMLVSLGRNDQAWSFARPAVDLFIQVQDFEQAADACDVLYNTEQDGSISALGQGIWLAVTYPVDLQLALALLQHLVEETPDHSDGAAVAAATASYLVDLRGDEKQMESLGFFANQLLGQVARRHSNVNSQEEFDAWFQRLELQDPAKFLPRLRNVVDVLVQDDWWFERESLQEKLPVH